MRDTGNRLSRAEVLSRVRSALKTGNYSQIPQLETEATTRTARFAAPGEATAARGAGKPRRMGTSFDFFTVPDALNDWSRLSRIGMSPSTSIPTAAFTRPAAYLAGGWRWGCSHGLIHLASFRSQSLFLFLFSDHLSKPEDSIAKHYPGHISRRQICFRLLDSTHDAQELDATSPLGGNAAGNTTRKHLCWTGSRERFQIGHDCSLLPRDI